MKQEEKQLLLVDLSARLPYGVIIKHGCDSSKLDTIFMCDSISISSTSMDKKLSYNLDLDEVKPYLFPLSSMTEEQKNELYEMCEELNIGFNSGTFTDMSGYGDIGIHKIQPIINYLLKNHFDIYGLIPMGLANDATGLNIY